MPEEEDPFFQESFFSGIAAAETAEITAEDWMSAADAEWWFAVEAVFDCSFLRASMSRSFWSGMALKTADAGAVAAVASVAVADTSYLV